MVQKRTYRVREHFPNTYENFLKLAKTPTLYRKRLQNYNDHQARFHDFDTF